MMQPQLTFGISVLLGLVVWGLIGARDIWPASFAREQATCAVLATAFAEVLTVQQMIEKLQAPA